MEAQWNMGKKNIEHRQETLIVSLSALNIEHKYALSKVGCFKTSKPYPKVLFYQVLVHHSSTEATHFH